MNQKKLLLLLPDGIGLRNFAFTSFVEIGRTNGWEVVFWHQTPFDLSTLGLKEVKLQGKPGTLTDLYKRAKINIELDYFTRKFNDPVYQSYKFPSPGKDLKGVVKNIIIRGLHAYYSGEKGVQRIHKKLKISEKNSFYYKSSINTLREEKPDLVFCTNQRAVNAIAPLLAAESLGIATACFIFSWDNLPKATMVIDTDYYFVWSDYMKDELLKYYSYCKPQQVKITGSPQFEHYFDEKLVISKEKFFSRYNLDLNTQYLCFSGDDITTSPHDQIYLRDVAQTVQQLNHQGMNIGIIFRRSPVDISDRYDKIIEEFKDVITPIDPLWEKKGERWNTILPTKEDLVLQAGIIQNTFLVINVGSSMLFDYQCYKKPGAYINYNPSVDELEKDINEIYKYVHFRSMPSKNAVLWINEREEIKETIVSCLQGKEEETVKQTGEWFKRINITPAGEANQRIWKEIGGIS